MKLIRIKKNEMKYLTKIITFCLCFYNLIVIAQTDEDKNWLLQQSLPNWTSRSFEERGFDKKYRISDFINPFYLEADFNVDGNQDIIVAIKEISSGKKGFIIFHGKSSEYFICGAGQKVKNGGDDYGWMDIWRVHRNLNAHELTYADNNDILGSKDLKLNSFGIVIKQSESGGGLLYWDGKQYRYARTSE